MKAGGWYGVDLDGTLAHYDQFRGTSHIGEPIGPMVDHVKQMLAQGKDVRVFTARVSPITISGRGRDQAEMEAELTSSITAIYHWCVKHIGQPLAITCTKDYQMISLFDDRCIQIIPNTGKRADGLPL